MIAATRRRFVAGISLGLGSVAATPTGAAQPAAADGHAAGLDVAPASNPLPLIPRRTGDPVVFSASLDTAPIKATSGGWAREVTSRTLPIATGIAGAHLFINAGGAREMHWHNSDEWAYVLAGNAQISAIDAAGEMETANVGAGDLWYFPRGHAHAIQTLGERPMHAILAFNDGLYGEHGTFGISDWMSRLDPALLARALGATPDRLSGMPRGETYIMQGQTIPLDGPQALSERPWPASRSHRHALTQAAPWVDVEGGTIHQAAQAAFPVSTSMTGLVMRLQPGAMQQPHWHATANEWLYVSQGRIEITLFAPDKRMALAQLGAGDCAYIPSNCGHTLWAAGDQRCEVISVLDSNAYEEASLADWLHKAPRHLLGNNLGLDESAVPQFSPGRPILAG